MLEGETGLGQVQPAGPFRNPFVPEGAEEYRLRPGVPEGVHHEFHYWDSTDNGGDLTAVKPLTGRSWRCGFVSLLHPHVHGHHPAPRHRRHLAHRGAVGPGVPGHRRRHLMAALGQTGGAVCPGGEGVWRGADFL